MFPKIVRIPLKKKHFFTGYPEKSNCYLAKEIIQTMNYVELNIQSLQKQFGCRDLCIRNFEFVAKTHFLCWNNGGRSRTKFNKFNSTSFQLLMNTKFNSTIFEKLCC